MFSSLLATHCPTLDYFRRSINPPACSPSLTSQGYTQTLALWSIYGVAYILLYTSTKSWLRRQLHVRLPESYPISGMSLRSLINPPTSLSLSQSGIALIYASLSSSSVRASVRQSRPSSPTRSTCSNSTIRSISLLFRSEEHTSELQSLMRISYAVFCLKQKKN